MININMIWLVSFTAKTSIIKTKIVMLHQDTLKTLPVNKKFREELGGENVVIKQCNNPDICIDGLNYCERYHKITYAETQHK